jgi:hypothetical protein
MKKILATFLLLALMRFCVSAQTFGATQTNYLYITGTTNSQVVLTNFFTVFLPAKTIFLTNVNPSETFTGSWVAVWPGFTNVYTFTNNFSTYTNVPNPAWWTTNISGQSIPIQVNFFMSAGLGNFTNGIYVP